MGLHAQGGLWGLLSDVVRFDSLKADNWKFGLREHRSRSAKIRHSRRHLVYFAPLDLISAHPWRRAAFTTYALSLSFFEAVILDALVRGGGREAVILADVDGVRVALGEQGARRVGKDYDVEPF